MIAGTNPSHLRDDINRARGYIILKRRYQTAAPATIYDSTNKTCRGRGGRGYWPDDDREAVTFCWSLARV
jgi:hypothetical protein